MIKTITIHCPEHIHYLLINKCKYYEYTVQEITALLLQKFVEGEFDELLNLPK